VLCSEDVRNILKNEILKIVKDFALMRQSSINNGFDRKIDGTLVTEADIKISNLIKSKIFLLGGNEKFNFYSEEDIGKFELPIIILDPIDGTKELVEGIPECAVSLAIIKNAKEYDYWLFNPFNSQEFFKGQSPIASPSQSSSLVGAVSRTEWSKGLFGKYLDDPEISVSPIGSIANKLMMLANHQLDFVISFRPKNVWDIAAGTLATWDQGYCFYEGGRKVTSLDSSQYQSPLLWCKEGTYDRLKHHFDR
jgi:myo-inositol-1(or 4)-monophosphatase